MGGNSIYWAAPWPLWEHFMVHLCANRMTKVHEMAGKQSHPENCDAKTAKWGRLELMNNLLGSCPGGRYLARMCSFGAGPRGSYQTSWHLRDQMLSMPPVEPRDHFRSVLRYNNRSPTKAGLSWQGARGISHPASYAIQSGWISCAAWSPQL